MYGFFRETMSKFIKNKSVPECAKKEKESSKDFIKEYANQWKDYTLYFYSIYKIFSYLDRFYIKNLGANGKTLTETALELWSQEIFLKKINVLQSAVNEEIRKDRMDETVDYDDIRLGIQ